MKPLTAKKAYELSKENQPDSYQMILEIIDRRINEAIHRGKFIISLQGISDAGNELTGGDFYLSKNILNQIKEHYESLGYKITHKMVGFLSWAYFIEWGKSE